MRCPFPALFSPFLRLLGLGLLLAGSAPAENLDTYGVWARGSKFDRKDFPYRGTEYSQSWASVEAREGVYNWKELEATLEESARLGLYVFLSINVGPDSPKWLYEQGIPSLRTTGHRHSGPYPFYPHPKHIEHYHRLIEEFGRHTRSLPARLTDRIAFVQVKTGATGDESPFKGVLTDKTFAISPAAWYDFRLAAFKRFQAAFQQGPGPVIPLMYTSVLNDDLKDYGLRRWVEANVKGAWGTKMGGTGQGYQINGEVERTANVLVHTIDPAPGTYELFTRCEMDQGWKEGIFARNIKQAFYWTSLSALHSGLTMWNLAQSAMDWHKENNYWEDLRIFDTYAGQLKAAQATGAFSALRDGLDAADTQRFPTATFGAASQKNEKRFTAIAAAYAAYGARMEDVSGVTAGMMNQRRNQQGLNDVGWDVFPGNYERFLHQIAANETSVGWWRVGAGGITETSPVYARFARGFEHKSGKNLLAFDIKDEFFSVKSARASGPIKIRIVYFDEGRGQWSLVYDAVDNPQKVAATVTKTNSGEWKELVVTVADGRFDNRGPRGADLALVNADDQDDIFHLVEITRAP